MSAGISVKGVARGAFIGGVAAGALNVGLYFVGAAMGADYRPKNPEQMGMAVLPPFQPMVICVLAAVVSIGVLALLSRITPTRAWPIYLGICVLVFAGEFAAPFFAFADMKTIVVLELMHLPATIGIIGGIYRYGVTRSPAA